MLKLAENRIAPALPIEDNNEFDYQKFNLLNCEDTLFSFKIHDSVDAVACQHYFVAPKKILLKETFCIIEDGFRYEVSKNACQFAKCYLTAKHQLVMGCFTQENNCFIFPNDLLAQFRGKILDLQLYWANNFLKSVYFYLRNRQSGRDVLTNKEIVQVFIGDVIQHIKSAEQFMKAANDPSSQHVSAQQLAACAELKSANQLLAKLHGGRAFLSGNIIEMVMIFEYLKDIYFN